MAEKKIVATIKTPRSTIVAESEDESFRVKLSRSSLSKDIELVTVTLEADQPIRPQPITLRWEHPLIDTQLQWSTEGYTNRYIMPEWDRKRDVTSKNTSAAPVQALLSAHGENRLTFALSDAKNPVCTSVGVYEENASALCKVTLFSGTMPELSRYRAVLRLDYRHLPCSTVLGDVAEWWASMSGFTPSIVPDHARLPMYSTWYAFHQKLNPRDLEHQCRLALDMGMKTIIVDDGWQTDDNSRGYAFTGDWQVAPSKFPDFAGHVKRVHDIGLKYMLWFSVPYIGSKSALYKKFSKKVLSPAYYGGAAALDPRYPEVREFLISTYERFLTNYKIDGFKLDFVDLFSLTREIADVPGKGKDFESIPDATDALLTRIMERLRRIRPDILIEFRQSYIGPLMRKYGNMFRAADVPADYMSNRVRTIDIRMLSGNTPAHSDMVMWHPDEPVESAMMQLVHTLFAVPQISVRIDKIPTAHCEALRFYLDFWTQNRDLLLDGTFLPQEPGSLYPLVTAQSKTSMLAAAYARTCVRIDDVLPQKTLLVNGTFDEDLTVSLKADSGKRRVVVRSCTGKIMTDRRITLKAGLHSLPVPPAGIVEITL